LYYIYLFIKRLWKSLRKLSLTIRFSSYDPSALAQFLKTTISSSQRLFTQNSFNVRCDDDVVVFKNCAKSDGSYDEKRIAQFVNDSLCSDFHRRFMNK